MGAKVENIEKNLVKLEITVEAAEFEKSMEQAFKNNRNKFNIPGFRKGKAPRATVERMYGEGVLYEDAINLACPPAYDKVVEENGLDPVDRPEIDVVSIGKGKDFVFTATVPTKPDIELGAYKGVEVEKPAVEVSEEDIDREIGRVRDRNGRMINIEDRAVANGDTVDIDYAGTVDGVPFDGGTAAGQPLVIGSGSFIPGFEEQLVGVGIGEEKDVEVTFPEQYHSEELAGKAAVFHCKINGIKSKELPELDDEFAKDVSEFDTLAEYREDMRKTLTATAHKNADKKFEEDVINAAAATCSVEIPNAMVERQLGNMMRQFDMSLRYQGMDLNRYMQMMGMNVEQFKSGYRSAAEGDVKIQLMLEKIIKLEGLEASDAELEAELVLMGEQYGQKVEEMKAHLHDHDYEDIKETICRKKAMKLIVDNAVAK